MVGRRIGPFWEAKKLAILSGANLLLVSGRVTFLNTKVDGFSMIFQRIFSFQPFHFSRGVVVCLLETFHKVAGSCPLYTP